MGEPKRSVIPAALMGGVDGLGLAIGVLVVLGGKAGAVLAAAAAANAGAELAGMSSGQYLSTRGEPYRIHKAAANGIGAAGGCLLPVIAFIGLGAPGCAAVLVAMVILMCAAIPSKPWYRSFIETFITVAIVAAVCGITAAIVPNN